MARLLQVVLPLSIALTVFAFVLATRREDGFYLLQRRGRLFRALASMYLGLPLVVVALVGLLDLEPALKVALVALSVSPVSPLIPRTEVKAGGQSSYAIGLLFTTCLLAVVTVPVGVSAAGRIFGRDVGVESSAILPPVLITVLAPVILGAAARALRPGLADRLSRPIQIGASVLLVLAFVPVLISSLGGMLQLIGDGTLFAIAVCITAGLVMGHLLAGSEEEDRTVLALSTISRHPAVAVAAGTAAAPREPLVVAAVLLYLIVSILASRLYVRWSRRGRPAPTDVEVGPSPVPRPP